MTHDVDADRRPAEQRSFPDHPAPDTGAADTGGTTSAAEADRANTRPGVFEQRIEIYTPPYLYRSSHPVLTGGPKSLRRGGTGGFTTAPGRAITSAKLIRPSAVTHVTDTDQRSVALGLRRTPGGITVTVPGNRTLVPSGWYMLFVTDDRGTPSDGRWVEVP